MTLDNKKEQLWESLNDPEFRKQIIDEHISVGIAFQIRSLRERQELTQVELAQLLGIRQPLLSSWENPNYGKYTLGTLKDLAKAFDVGLLVRFVPFSTLIDWTVNLSKDTIAPPNFNEEDRSQIATSASAFTNFMKKIGCEDTKGFDAYGNINVNETILSSTTGTIKELEHA
ncbi:MAG: helix-turn-helix transcriptional regulator [Dehalococcoidales bacterium]|nr:helix-turn-helix transcriptional regulator [Dehalococcoidales bacterium]